MSARNHEATVGALMLVAGGVIGAGLALLFAPQSGRRTRKQLARYGREVRNEAEARVRDAAETLNDTVEGLGEKTEDWMEQGGEVAQEWRQHLLDSIDQGQRQLKKQRERLVKRWS